ncbi:hypothetical protein NHH82_02735 [Oxalobacteraceae bacterium OTU3REALA1]|nr:hypothetical protein NHH82_02735 [Oxalobacteraceae bacterium OTU3REALA1]
MRYAVLAPFLSTLWLSNLPAHAGPATSTGKDERCLLLAKYGQTVAESKAFGLSEQQIKEFSAKGRDSSRNKVKLTRTDDQVVAYIFTVDVKPTDAR